MGGCDKHRIRVLIVDDSPFIRRVIHLLLDDAGDFEVVGEAENGLVALEMFQSQKPDLITLDQEMPVLNGIETLKRLREVSDVPVIIVSALPMAEFAVAGGVGIPESHRVIKTFSNNPIDLSVFAEELTTKLRDARSDYCAKHPMIGNRSNL